MKRCEKLFVCTLLVAAMLLNLTSCNYTRVQSTDLSKTYKGENATEQLTDETFTASQMDFAVNLFQSSALKSENENILISPLSVMLALSMTANGADEDTKSEMETVLAGNCSITELNEYLHTYVQNLPSGKKYQLHIANSIWIRDDESLTVNEDFLQTNATYYDAQIYRSAFDKQTLQDINAWVNENTAKMIPKILEDIDGRTVMYLINALAFDAEWDTIYDSFAVQDGMFTSVSGDTRTVEMMHSNEYSYLDDGKATGFIKNYKDGKYRFAALLPNEDIAITDYIAGLSSENLMETLQNAEEVAVNTALPKFSYDYSASLKEILISLGIKDAFDADFADFSKLGTGNSGNLYITDVLHKTFISVDERGTQAGAATAVAVAESSAQITKQVHLNRPFVYMIIDGETNLPMFIGAVMDITE